MTRLLLVLVLLLLTTTLLLGAFALHRPSGPSLEEQARAAQIQQQTQDQAKRAEIERERAQVEADAERALLPDRIMAMQIIMYGLAGSAFLGLFVVLFGLPLGGLIYLAYQAGKIYPNEAGIFPVIIRRNCAVR